MSDDKTRIVSAVVGPGTQLNGIYEIDERIAIGGMGEVYRGHNIQTEDPVAIKIVLPEFAKDSTIIALFKKEAKLLSHLHHDAIVRYHVFTIDPAIGLPYLAMEFVDGESLADHIKRGPIDPPTARRLIARIASGLSAAHAAGVIHRDLSPDNIILPGDNVDRAKIIDFGIAKSATVGGGTLLGGKFAGKYNFVSPEQLGDFGGEVTAQSDIYSLGLVFAAVLRGQALDMGGSQVEVIEKRRSMPDLAGIDPTLRPVVETMLQPDPRNRPPSMDVIAEWLATPVARTTYSPGMPSYENAEQGTYGAPIPAAPAPLRSGVAGSLQTGLAGSIPASARPFPGGSMPGYPAAYPSQPPLHGSAGSLSSTPLPGSQPPYGPAGGPAGAGSAPPLGESPFSQPPHSQPQPQPQQFGGSLPTGAYPAATAPRGKSRGGIYAALLLLLAAGGGAGAYFSGALDRAPASGEQEAAARPSLTPGNEQEAAAVEPDAAVDAAPPADAQPAPPASEGQAAETEAPKEEEMAALTRPDEPQPPASEQVYDAATRIAWLRDYSGGSCFYAAATSASEDAVAIEGFGTSAAPFQELLQAFETAHKVEPDIGVRIIEPEQCAVADFLHALRNTAEERPVLSLSSDLIKSGDAIRGELQNLDGRTTDILLVDNMGVVYNLASHLRRAGDDASFNIKLGLQTPEPVPQMIIAIASPQGLDSAEVTQPILAATLFPKMLDEIRSKNIDAAATAKYFKLGG